MRMERLEFREALEQLADRAGITVPRGKGGLPADDRAALWKTLDWAAARFRDCLKTAPEAAAAREYLAGRGLEAFFDLTATAPARIYNLPGKGAIQPGFDADIAIWDATREVTITDEAMHDLTGFTPFAGYQVTGWPETVIRRGEVVVSDGTLHAKAGSGRWLSRTGGPAAEPTGNLVLEMDPERNFGATIL
jgi:hypothetical protein